MTVEAEGGLDEFEEMLELARGLLGGHDGPGELWDANEAANRAIALRPTAPDGWLVKCQVLSALEDDTAALACVEMAIRRAPKTAEPHYWRASILADLGRSEDALRSIARALRTIVRADDWLLEEIYFEKARILGELDKNELAVEVLNEGLLRCPGSALLRAGLEPLQRARVRGLLSLVPGGR